MSRTIKTLQAVMMKEDGQASHLPAQRRLQGVKTPQNKLGRAPYEARFELQEAKAVRKSAVTWETKQHVPPARSISGIRKYSHPLGNPAKLLYSRVASGQSTATLLR